MYFIANWKMFGALKTLNSLKKVISYSNNNKKNKLNIIYCPPTTLIRPLFKKLIKSSIEVGAQNCHESKSYASLTGQINSGMLKDIGAKYVILGHSENRQTGEDNILINKKIKSSLKSGLKVILCIGETLKEKKNNKTNKVLNSKIKDCLSGIKNYSNVIMKERSHSNVTFVSTAALTKAQQKYGVERWRNQELNLMNEIKNI